MTGALPTEETLAALAEIAFALPRANRDEITAAAERARAVGVDESTLREAILQQAPFSGFPAVIDAFGILGLRAAPENDGDPADFPTRGRETFERVYGSVTERVLDQLRGYAPELERWILEFAYGRVMGRPSLPLAAIEVMGACAVLAQGRATPLKSHVRGALRCGVERDVMERVLEGFRGRARDEVLEVGLGR